MGARRGRVGAALERRMGTPADPHLIAIRIARLLLYKTKPELIEAFRSLEKDGALEETMDSLQATGDFLKDLRTVIRTAQVRFLSAGAAFAESEGEAGQ